MTNERLMELLTDLISAQDNVTHLNEQGPEFEQQTREAIGKRSGVRNDIMREVEALRARLTAAERQLVALEAIDVETFFKSQEARER